MSKIKLADSLLKSLIALIELKETHYKALIKAIEVLPDSLYYPKQIKLLRNQCSDIKNIDQIVNAVNGINTVLLDDFNTEDIISGVENSFLESNTQIDDPLFRERITQIVQVTSNLRYALK